LRHAAKLAQYSLGHPFTGILNLPKYVSSAGVADVDDRRIASAGRPDCIVEQLVESL
jgi:hypothetical protein